MFSSNHLQLLTLRKLTYLPYVEKALPVPYLIERYDNKEGLLTKKSRKEAIGRIHQFGYESPDLDYKIMKSGLQYAVNACQNALGWFSNRVANLASDWGVHGFRLVHHLKYHRSKW